MARYEIAFQVDAALAPASLIAQDDQAMADSRSYVENPLDAFMSLATCYLLMEMAVSQLSPDLVSVEIAQHIQDFYLVTDYRTLPHRYQVLALPE